MSEILKAQDQRPSLMGTKEAKPKRGKRKGKNKKKPAKKKPKTSKKRKKK